MTKSIRAGDCAARYGGEEFLCILPHALPKQALQVAERIRSETESYPFICGNRRVKISVSIGTATGIHSSAQKYDQLIFLADQALYEAKEKGRNCIIQAEKMFEKGQLRFKRRKEISEESGFRLKRVQKKALFPQEEGL